jgi:hypothetical protein
MQRSLVKFGSSILLHGCLDVLVTKKSIATLIATLLLAITTSAQIVGPGTGGGGATPAGSVCGQPQVLNTALTGLAASKASYDGTQCSSSAAIPAGNGCGSGSTTPLTNDDAGAIQAAICEAPGGSTITYYKSSGTYTFGSDPFFNPSTGASTNKKIHLILGGGVFSVSSLITVPSGSILDGVTPALGIGSDPNNYQTELRWTGGGQTVQTDGTNSWTNAFVTMGTSGYGPPGNTTSSGVLVRYLRINCNGAANLTGLNDNGAQELSGAQYISISACNNDSGTSGTVTSISTNGTTATVTLGTSIVATSSNYIALINTGTSCDGIWPIASANNGTNVYTFATTLTCSESGSGTGQIAGLTQSLRIGSGGPPFGSESDVNSEENSGPWGPMNIFIGKGGTWTAIPLLINNEASVNFTGHITINGNGGGFRSGQDQMPCVGAEISGPSIHFSDIHVQGASGTPPNAVASPCDNTTNGYMKYGVRLGYYGNAQGIDLGPITLTSSVKQGLDISAANTGNTGSVSGLLCQSGCVTYTLNDETPGYTVNGSTPVYNYNIGGLSGAGGNFIVSSAGAVQGASFLEPTTLYGVDASGNVNGVALELQQNSSCPAALTNVGVFCLNTSNVLGLNINSQGINFTIGSAGNATLGKSGTAGTLALFPGSGNFETTIGSVATANNTINFFATVPTNLHLFYCATLSTVCTLTDAGYAYNAIPAADIASGALASGMTATSQSACDNSTKLATTAYSGLTCNTVETSGSPLSATAQSQTLWNNSSGAYVVDLPAPTASGPQICLGNYKTVAHAISFVPGTGVTIYYKGVAGTSGSSTGLVSGGAAGDFICVEGTDSTTYTAIGAGQGTWTNN